MGYSGIRINKVCLMLLFLEYIFYLIIILGYIMLQFNIIRYLARIKMYKYNQSSSKNNNNRLNKNIFKKTRTKLEEQRLSKLN